MLYICGIGSIIHNSISYDACISNNKCIIANEDFKLITDLNQKWVEFKWFNSTYEKEFEYYKSFMVFLENPKYINSNQIEFEISYAFQFYNKKIKNITFTSKALTNFYNEKINAKEFKKEYLIKKLEETMHKTSTYEVPLSFGLFSFRFENEIFYMPREEIINNIFPFDFKTTLTIEKKNENICYDEILKLIKYFFDFNRFISLNKYTKIDDCFIELIDSDENDSVIEVGIFKNYMNNYKFEECFNILDFGDSITKFLVENGKFLNHSDNMYHFENGKTYAFDSVRISGAFEKIFKKYVKVNEIEGNQQKNQSKYLKDKLEYIFKKYCDCLNYNYDKAINFFYDPKNMSVRFKDARNDIAHGLENDKINWYKVSKDGFFVQQLIYFMILKYALNVPNEKIKNSLCRIYRWYNYSFVNNK